MTNQLPAGLAQPAAMLQFMIGGVTTSQLIYVAAKLGIADCLHDGPKGSDQLAAEVGAQPESLYRLLRALAVMGLFTETEGRAFALSPLGALLQTTAPQSLRAWAILHGEELYRTWEGLLHSVQTGQPGFDHAYGIGWWDYLDQHPQTAAVFNQRMTSVFAQRNTAIAAAYAFWACRTIVDVAGGQGSLLAAILNAHPSVRGVLFDLPAVVEAAPPLLEQAGVGKRCEVVGGDMFDALPSGGDAYLLATIIHDWNDEQAVAILRNCRRAMTDQAKLLLIE
ncbi:MAG: methyltransferase, partial [Chloroflexi bacterium]|nr:methyltransferase [Chloroflexota bacterium]